MGVRSSGFGHAGTLFLPPRAQGWASVNRQREWEPRRSRSRSSSPSPVFVHVCGCPEPRGRGLEVVLVSMGRELFGALNDLSTLFPEQCANIHSPVIFKMPWEEGPISRGERASASPCRRRGSSLGYRDCSESPGPRLGRLPASWSTRVGAQFPQHTPS